MAPCPELWDSHAALRSPQCRRRPPRTRSAASSPASAWRGCRAAAATVRYAGLAGSARWLAGHLHGSPLQLRCHTLHLAARLTLVHVRLSQLIAIRR